MTSVKWLTSIEAVSEPFDGYQQAIAYHYKRDADDPGEPVTRLRVRALMVPPGIPDFFTRQRVAEAGQITLSGRAWSGDAPIERVEVGLDGEWREATLGPEGGSVRLACVVVRVGRDRRRSRAVVPGVGRSGEHPAARPAMELPGSRKQLGPALQRHRSLTDVA